MAIDDKIRDEKLHCDINREAAKISALSSGKIDKNEYLTGEEYSTVGCLCKGLHITCFTGL